MGPDVGVQSPPNLNPGRTRALIDAGLSDWGGISPVTIDHVNPEAPWPQIDALAEECAEAGFTLVERLTAYPKYIAEPARWFDPKMATALRKSANSHGLGRETSWCPGGEQPAPGNADRPLGEGRSARIVDRSLDRAMARAARGETLDHSEIVTLFEACAARSTATRSPM